ncbi:MAG: FAD-dependent oxidoreductase [Armatimonadota bacterium]|jgi:hypothetical protein
MGHVLTEKLCGDVCVVGGGMAGLAAAVTAARQGSSVMLVQDRPVLGGNASGEIRVHITGADVHGRRPYCRETGILEEVRLENSLRNPARTYPVWDLVLGEFVSREPNVRLLLNATCVGARMDGPRIAAALVEQPVHWRRYEVEATTFIDCSGDGRLAVEAGADHRRGREARHEYGESAAPEQADECAMGSSLLLQTVDVGRPVEFAPPSWAHDFREGGLPPGRRPRSGEMAGYWWVELGGDRHPTHAGPALRRELLAVALGVFDYVKNSGEYPEAETLALGWIGQLPGRRSGLRFLGDHVLRQQDLEEPPGFRDRVAYGGWPMDRHPPAGFFSPDPPADFVHVPDVYSIPLGSLYSRNVENLYLAGRCHSATFTAHGSTRVMGTCVSMGQAVGMAAAVGIERGAGPRAVRERHVPEVQQRLLKEDVFLVDVRNEDPDDLARCAAVTASSSASDEAGPEQATGGVSRPRGDAMNMWASAPGRVAGEWIEVAWDGARAVREVRLTFDTDLEPEFSFSIFPYREPGVLAPVAETVADYRIEVPDGDAWRTVARTEGNYQRHRIHRFDPVQTERLRVSFERTHGADQVRLYELRAY